MSEILPTTHPTVTAAPTSQAPMLIPETPAMTKRTYASPMSYVGSLRRVTAWIRNVGTTPARAYAAWTVGVLGILAMWAVVLPIYYFFTVILFGFFMIPFRLVRRSHRKQEHLQQAQLATMQSLLVQQQQALAESQNRQPSGPRV